MMKRIIRIKLLHLSLILFLAMNTGCYYDQVYVAPAEPPEGDVSYATDVQPIFTGKCVSCHSVGSPAGGLDLSEGNSYNNINKLPYVDLSTPTESLIYTKPHSTGSHFTKYSTTDEAAVLKWIEQGAKNN